MGIMNTVQIIILMICTQGKAAPSSTTAVLGPTVDSVALSAQSLRLFPLILIFVMKGLVTEPTSPSKNVE